MFASCSRARAKYARNPRALIGAAEATLTLVMSDVEATPPLRSTFVLGQRTVPVASAPAGSSTVVAISR